MTQSGYQVSGNAAENYERFVSAFMSPWAENLVAAAGLSDGDRVLDLGCGTGFVARIAAAAVGPDGHVTGVDVNPMMLDVARTIGSFEIVEAAADATGITANSVDVVICQQGLQYFPDPAAALAESVRFLRSGGRALFSVWAPFAANPFIAGQIDALEPHLDAAAVDAFRGTNVDALGGPASIAELLRAAGLRDVTTRTERLTVDLPPMSTFFPDLISATPWAPTFAGLDADQRRAVIEHMEGAVTTCVDPAGSTAEMTAVIASGTAP